MSQIIEHLEKVLGDLVGNRGRLAQQLEADKLQAEVNQLQLEHFDTLIAATRHALGDSTVLAKIEEIRSAAAQPNMPHEHAHAPAPVVDPTSESTSPV